MHARNDADRVNTSESRALMESVWVTSRPCAWQTHQRPFTCFSAVQPGRISEISCRGRIASGLHGEMALRARCRVPLSGCAPAKDHA